MRRRSVQPLPLIPTALMSIIGAAGVVAVIGGFMGWFETAKLEKRRASIAELVDLRSAAPGVRGFLDGVIAADVRPLKGEYVAYFREEYRSKSSSRWVWLEGWAQPLAIDTIDGRWRVVNNDYVFDREIDSWSASEREESPPGIITGAIRIQGLVAGAPVLIVGRRSDDVPDARAVVAESVAGLDRGGYLTRIDGDIATNRKVTRALLLAAPVLIGAAVWLGRWLLRQRR